MVAGPFDHGHGAGIAHRKTLAGNAAEVTFAFDRAVEHGVADDDRFLRHDPGIGGRGRGDAATPQSLAAGGGGGGLRAEGYAPGKPRRRHLSGGRAEPSESGTTGITAGA